MSDEGGDAACYLGAFDLSRPDLRTRADIHRFVQDFYRAVAMDDLLGPVFEAADVDWYVHHGVLTDYWCGQLLGQPGYDGQPLRAHGPVDARTPFTADHYERWLELFETTLDERWAGPIAERARARAHSFAAALRRALPDRGANPT